jgi:predicted anti-sigma-YlaC factor YlaD
VTGIDYLWNGSCDETRTHLSEHLEGDLRGIRRWRILRHLDRCERCQAVLRSLIRALEQLRSVGRVDPPPSEATATAVVDRVRREATDGSDR